MQHPTPRLTAQDFDQELLILFDAYVHGNIDRRGFLEKAQKFAVGGVTAVGLLAALSPNFAIGQVVPKTDATTRQRKTPPKSKRRCKSTSPVSMSASTPPGLRMKPR